MSGRCTMLNITETLFGCITDRQVGDQAFQYNAAE